MHGVTLVDVIEAGLGISFTHAEIVKFDFNYKNIENLAVGVEEFHKSFSLPEKSLSEFRPSISPGFGRDHSIGFHHVAGVSGVDVDKAIKKYLLFSHSLVIEDPLVYLLDYFRSGVEDEYSQERMPRIKELLSQYSKAADLIRREILFPIAGEPRQIDRINYLPEKWVEEICRLLPEMSKTVVRGCCQRIAEERYSLSTLDDRADYFFPSPEYVAVLHEIVRLEKAHYVREDLDRPFGMSVMGKISGIDPDGISIQDLVDIRMNDAVLADWRQFLDDSFGELRQYEKQYSDLNRQYMLVAQKNFDAWDKKISGQLSKGSLGKNLRKSIEEISYGAFTGAAVGASMGAIFGTSGALVGGAAGAIKSGIDKAKDLIKVSTSEGKVKAVRNHFMALGVLKK